MLYRNHTVSLFYMSVHLYAQHVIQCACHQIFLEYHLAATLVFNPQFPFFIPNDSYRREMGRIALLQSKTRDLNNSSRPKAGKVKRAWLTGSHFAYSADR